MAGRVEGIRGDCEPGYEEDTCMGVHEETAWLRDLE